MSELARLKAGRPHYTVQGTTLDNVAETFIEVDGQRFSLMVNKDDLRDKAGTTVKATATKVNKSVSRPVSDDDDTNYTLQGERRIEFYMQTIAEMLHTTTGFDYAEFHQRWVERAESEEWVEAVWQSGAVKYWEKGILNDFVKYLKGYENR